MTNVYTSSTAKRSSYSLGSKRDDKILRIEIAENFSDYCTKSLLIAVHQMNKDITRFITTDLAGKD